MSAVSFPVYGGRLSVLFISSAFQPSAMGVCRTFRGCFFVDNEMEPLAALSLFRRQFSGNAVDVRGCTDFAGFPVCVSALVSDVPVGL